MLKLSIRNFTKIGIYLLLVPIIAYSAKAQKNINIIKSNAKVNPDYPSKSISGEVKIDFRVDKKCKQVKLDAQNMKAELIDASARNISLTTNQKFIIIKGKFKPKKKYQVNIQYDAQPKQTLYFVPTKNGYQIWTQGQGKDTSHWLPTNDDMNDKGIFNLSITIPEEMSVVANGKLKNISDYSKNENLWEFQMKKPMSSYLLSFAIGNFAKQESKKHPLEYYLATSDSLNMEPTFRHSQQIFEYLEDKTGYDYPWQNYKQVAVKDFLYAGMENTTCTIFSDAFVVDSTGFIDRNYVNVNAHEMAHQWFGNLVTEKSSKHHWLHEGFATYYALLAEKEVFGEDYFYFKLYQNAKQLYDRSKKGSGEKVMRSGASSLTYYQAGAWALHALQEQIGNKKFDDIIRTYLKENEFQNVITTDFLSVVDSLSSVDTLAFKNKWLNQTAFQGKEALDLLKKNSTIKKLMKLESLRKVPFEKKKNQLQQALQLPIDQFLGQEAVYQLPEPASNEVVQLYLNAFSADEHIVRQVISERLSDIPTVLQSNYETLLNDDSYLTRQNALLHLWMSFPDKRAQYLDQMKNEIGFNDYNIRTLWLALAIATNEYQPEKSFSYLEELIGFTSKENRYQTRRNAFQYLYQINIFRKKVLKNLIEACLHHNWRFKNFSRDLFKKWMEKASNKDKLKSIDLSKEKQQIVDKLLKG